MSTLMEDDIKRWTAKRKTTLVLDIIQGKTTVSEASRAYDLNPSEVEQWVDEGKRGMENALRSKPLEIKEQYERQLSDLQQAYGEAMLELRARKAGIPAGQRGREMILSLQQGLAEDGVLVSLVKLCQWFKIPRRTVYYRSAKSAPKVQEHLVHHIKALIEENPSFGYRTVAHLLGFERTPCSASSRSKAGRCASGQWASDLASRPFPRWPRRPMNVGPLTCAVCGRGAMAGPHWPW